MTNLTASNNPFVNSTPSNSARNQRTRRRAGIAALAALGLPLGALLAPSAAAAAPGDPVDDIDIVLPLDLLPLNPADFEPFNPVPELPETPAPFPTPDPVPEEPMTPEGDPPGPPITLLPETPLVLLPEPFVPPAPDDFPDPDDVPGPDDGPVPTFELPVPDEPFEVLPFDPEDLILPTDDGDDDAGDGDDEPECNDYAAGNFSVTVDRYDADLIEVQLAYTDPDVCDYTVWSAIAEPAAVDVLAETTVGMESIATATDSAGYYQQTFLDSDLCDLEIRVAVEESLPFTIAHTDDGCEDDGETPEDDGETPDEARPLGEPETPGTPPGGLPQTGTDLTTVMLAIGLMTLGAGSVIALATRRQEELPIA